MEDSQVWVVMLMCWHRNGADMAVTFNIRFFLFLHTGRASLRKPAPGSEGPPRTIGEHQPQHAKLCSIPQVLLCQCIWRQCLIELSYPPPISSVIGTFLFHCGHLFAMEIELGTFQSYIFY